MSASEDTESAGAPAPTPAGCAEQEEPAGDAPQGGRVRVRTIALGFGCLGAALAGALPIVLAIAAAADSRPLDFFADLPLLGDYLNRLALTVGATGSPFLVLALVPLALAAHGFVLFAALGLVWGLLRRAAQPVWVEPAPERPAVAERPEADPGRGSR